MTRLTIDSTGLRDSGSLRDTYAAYFGHIENWESTYKFSYWNEVLELEKKTRPEVLSNLIINLSYDKEHDQRLLWLINLYCGTLEEMVG